MRFKHQHKKSEFLNSTKGFDKFMVQCVVCQEIGYDPDKLSLKENKYFEERAKENLPSLKVNKISVCELCAERVTK